MLRVLGTIQNSRYAKSMMSEQKDLADWVQEIQDGMYGVLVSLQAAAFAMTSLIALDITRIQIGCSKIIQTKTSP
jgi:hypothetical protein